MLSSTNSSLVHAAGAVRGITPFNPPALPQGGSLFGAGQAG